MHALLVQLHVTKMFLKIERSAARHDVECPAIAILVRRRQYPPSRVTPSQPDTVLLDGDHSLGHDTAPADDADASGVVHAQL